MSFNFGKKHNVRGKHFKLFSDELPRVELDRNTLDKYESFAADQRQRRRGKRRPVNEAHTDRMSLPSLGTPETEMLSDYFDSRPNSMQSPTFSALNPNFARVQKKIQRRNTLRETFHTNNETLQRRISFRDKFAHQIPKPNQNQESWKKHDQTLNTNQRLVDHLSIMKSDAWTAHDNVQGDSDAEHIFRFVITDKPPTPKKKSLFNELLDASQKENNRINRIREGLNFNESSLRRRFSMKQNRNLKLEALVDTTENSLDNDFIDSRVPEIISDGEAQSKPGILKRGARCRKSVAPQQNGELYLRPRLIHQEDLPLLRAKARGIQPETDGANEVRISVYTEAPLNRTNDMLFVPLPSSHNRKRSKRVNFHEAVIKEITEISESDFDGLSIDKSTKSRVKVVETPNGEKKLKKVPIKGGKDALNDAVDAFRTDRKAHFQVSTISASPKADLNEDTQDYIDSILMSNKNYENPSLNRVTLSNLVSNSSASDAVDDVAKANSQSSLSPMGMDHVHKNETHSLVENNHAKVRELSGSISHSSEQSTEKTLIHTDIHEHEFTEYASFIDDDDFDINNLPEEIDRSMTGEELIRAYRIWDRKRKAFPGGLRKINEPLNLVDPYLSKRFGTKTFRGPSIPSPRTEVSQQKTVQNGGKTTQKSVLVDWV
ncbi:hypothetical protein DPMN_057444 [Dreissena polymorpha]|uniref:Uncharacterized protein n=1 Tax=Dreissena polymorpha TaxID=45954 RepID=A0A9D4C065_DREPO|nr:hypothetical protein DPMN_057444 [Dreissena polymorpha]